MKANFLITNSAQTFGKNIHIKPTKAYKEKGFWTHKNRSQLKLIGSHMFSGRFYVLVMRRGFKRSVPESPLTTKTI